MAEFEITSPSGEKFIINAPDDATEAQVMEYAKNQFSQMGNKVDTPAPVEKPEDQSDILGTIGQFAQGATFGFGDEITGHEFALLGKTPEGDWFDYSKPYAERYEAARDWERQRQADYREQSPYLATGAEIAGAIASPVSKIGHVGKGASMVEKMARGAGQGLGQGALYGAGEAEEMGDIPSSMIAPATTGVVAGAALPPVLAGLGKTASAVINPFLDRLPFKQKSAAARHIAKAIQDEGLTPQQAIEKVKAMGPDAALMDVGENLRGQARAVHSMPSEGRAMLTDFLSKRQEGTRGISGLRRGGQFDRVEQALSDLGDDYHLAKEGVVRARQKLGDAYQGATGQMDDLVDIAPVLKELDDDIAQSKGGIKDSLNKIRGYLVDEKGNPEIDINSLHQAKMAIDELMTGEAKTSMGKIAKNMVRRYQDKLVGAIEGAGEAGKLYQQGRLGTAGQWRIDDALDKGREFLLGSKFKDAADLNKYMKNLNPDELEAFRTGIIQKLKEQIGKTRYTANTVKEVMGKPDLERKLISVFGADDFRRLMQQMDNEQALYDTYSAVRGGSPTARIGAEQESLMRDPSRLTQGFRGLVSGDIAQMTRGAYDVGGAIIDRAQLPEGVSREMAEALMSRGNVDLAEEGFKKLEASEAMRNKLANALRTGAVYGAK